VTDAIHSMMSQLKAPFGRCVRIMYQQHVRYSVGQTCPRCCLEIQARMRSFMSRSSFEVTRPRNSGSLRVAHLPSAVAHTFDTKLFYV